MRQWDHIANQVLYFPGAIVVSSYTNLTAPEICDPVLLPLFPPWIGVPCLFDTYKVLFRMGPIWSYSSLHLKLNPATQ